MPKQYCLLKDTYRTKAGTILEYRGDFLNGEATGFYFYFAGGSLGGEQFPPIFVENTPEWFDLVKNRWEAAKGDKVYLLIPSSFEIREFTENFGNGGPRQYEFRTREFACEALRRINKAMEDYHEEIGE